MHDEDTRVEQAWMRLEAWAHQWHHRTNKGYFVGTMGGSPKSQVYFQHADLDCAVSVVGSLNASNPVIVCKKNVGERTVEVSLKDVRDFKEACRKLGTRECHFFAAFVDVTLDRGTPLEVSLAMDKVTVQLVDLTMIFSPHLAFFNALNLKDRFESIFRYFLSLQKSVHAQHIFFGSSTTPSENEQRIEL